MALHAAKAAISIGLIFAEDFPCASPATGARPRSMSFLVINVQPHVEATRWRTFMCAERCA
jgi:hypothetical protein